MSLRHFYSFLLSDKPDGINFNWLNVSASREKVKMWSASYKKESPLLGHGESLKSILTI